MTQFDLPKEQSSILKVIGIGGGGGNAVNHMFGQNIEGVDFIICNTDSQALAHSNVPNKVQLGPHLTQGLGAGANPEIGKEATEESLEEIKRILEVNTKMAFITAGMGGGTGTGGAPIVAKVCKDLDILTVGIVTTPFAYEGKKRIAQAMAGINNLKEYVDTLLVISNDKLRHQFGNLTMKAAFSKADDVLATAAKCITDVINSTGQINVDFADVCTVMRNGGVAILGSAECDGDNRAQKAIEQALNSPLLNDNDISGAKWILININSAEGEHEFTMDEVDIIQNYLMSKAGENSDVILGLGYDNNLGNKIGITIIATGFEVDKEDKEPEEPKNKQPQKEVLELKPVEKKNPAQPLFLFEVENGNEDETVSRTPPVKDEVRNEIIDEEAVNETLKEQREEAISEELMPVIEEPQKQDDIVGLRWDDGNNTVDKTNEDRIEFELSSSPETESTPESDCPARNTSIAGNKETVNENKEAINPLSSRGLPVKPSRIYDEEDIPERESESLEKLSPLQSMEQEDETAEEMQLVEKNSNKAAEPREEEKVHQTMPIMMSDAEEPSPTDEAEELRRRAMDRIAKLRNLSFNINASDPNNEFESVPAYLRRNLELHNPIASVESFYTNYRVRSDENNKAEISTINSFLDGKKPD